MSDKIRRAQSVRRFVLTAAILGGGPLLPAWAAGDISGRYAILRDSDSNTGCMLTLRPGSKAQLAPACRDNGIVIFDPVSWSLDHGKLVLTARKGHKAHFDKDAEGVWRRDSGEGKALSLKPL